PTVRRPTASPPRASRRRSSSRRPAPRSFRSILPRNSRLPTRTEQKLGWIGAGRMGYAMAERLAKGGCDIAVWNRTAEKAKPLAQQGAKVARLLPDLAAK